MNDKEKLSLFFGPEKKSKKKETVSKDWSSDWLKMKEANLLEQGGKITSPYSQSAWVYRAIRVIGENVPTAQYKIFNGEQVLPITNPIVQLFANPNPMMSRFDFWESISSWLNLRGEAFIFVNQSVGGVMGRGTAPAELWVLDPTHMKHTVEDGRIVGWTWGNQVPFEPHEIIHLPLWNPKGIRGQSPIAAARAEMESDYSASQWNKTFFENNAVPDGVISVDKDVSLEIEDLRKIKKMWYENHGGQGNSHKTAFLLGGMDYKNMGISQKDMEFIVGRQFARDAIYAIYGVPPFVAGHYDSGTVTRATARESKRLFWTGTLIPQLKRIEEKFAVKFFPVYAPGLLGKFDFGNVEELQEDFNASVISGKDLFALGYTRNEINSRLQLGMPRDDTDGDIRYLPINLVPTGEDETPPAKEANERTTKKAKFTPEQKNAFARRYARLQRQIENLLNAKIKKLMFNQRKNLLKIMNGSKATLQQMELLAEIGAFFQEEQGKWVTVTEPILREAAEESIDMALDNIGAATRQFIVNEEIIKNRLNMIKGANNTIFRQVKDQINDGIKEGEAIATISDRIRSVYNVSQNRARVIARTETSSLMSAQTLDVYTQSGITRKSWVTAGDDAVRETHEQNASDGAIGIDKTFSGTGEKYPGESEINCRCALVPEVIEET